MSTGYDNAYSTYGVYGVETDTQRRTFGRIPNATYVRKNYMNTHKTYKATG